MISQYESSIVCVQIHVSNVFAVFVKVKKGRFVAVTQCFGETGTLYINPLRRPSLFRAELHLEGLPNERASTPFVRIEVFQFRALKTYDLRRIRFS
jgi:hypothetical protein